MTDKLKIVFSFLLFVAGIVGFYLLSDQVLVLRILVILIGLVLAGVVFWKTVLGQKTFGFINESIVEAKRVVWPTRKETIQMTITVFVLVAVMAVFLGLVDITFSYMINWLLGRG
ncbi:protein translocase subunit SecE [Methylophilaceae bacterium]|jgi:preprotein translocase subunit SecE|nr:protein translocase subunit SecE [Methylophilaceae bacterium]